MKFASLIFVILLNVTVVMCYRRRYTRQTQLELIREWKQLDFNFPSAAARADAIQKGWFVPANAFPLDVDIDYRDSLDRSRIFVTIPRFNEGVPVTLGYVKSPKSDLLIQPYPDYSWHSSHGADCDKITSVLRIAIDECKRLWVLDSGVIGSTKKCPPQLLVFNLQNDKLIKRYKFPQSQHTADSLFATPIVDVKDPPPFGRCQNTKVYIADVTGFSLIVYDNAINKSWKIQNKLFEPVTGFTKFTIASESFDLNDGILGLALSPKQPFDASTNLLFGSFQPFNERFLYFHSLASATENRVSLSVINNAQTWAQNSNSQPGAFQTIGSRGVQTAAQAMDSNGNLFFVLLNPIALVCWDSSTPYSKENIKVVYQNDATLQFASGLKVARNMVGMEEIWILTNRFQKIAASTLSSTEINFRIQVKQVDMLLNGNTKCNGQSYNGNSGLIVFP